MASYCVFYVNSIEVDLIATILGVSARSIQRWNKQFRTLGHVSEKTTIKKSAPWPQYVIQYVEKYTMEHPCFYIEELQQAIKEIFPELVNTSASTICRVLKFHLNLTRKVLEKRALESSDIEIKHYYA